MWGYYWGVSEGTISTSGEKWLKKSKKEYVQYPCSEGCQGLWKDYPCSLWGESFPK